MSQHKCIGGKNRGRNRRESVNGKEGADCGELAVDFFFFNIKKTSDVFNHLLVGKGHLVTGRTVQRGRGDDIGGIASTVGGR